MALALGVDLPKFTHVTVTNLHEELLAEEEQVGVAPEYTELLHTTVAITHTREGIERNSLISCAKLPLVDSPFLFHFYPDELTLVTTKDWWDIWGAEATNASN